MSNPYTSLHFCLQDLLMDIRKDLRQDHLNRDPVFCRTHFKNKPLRQITKEELVVPYEKLLLAGDQSLADFVAHRWLVRHGDIYRFFEEELSAIRPDFDQIKEIEEGAGDAIVERGVALFSPRDLYIFSVLNRVAFAKKTMEALCEQAKQR